MKHMRLLISFAAVIIAFLVSCSKQETEKPQETKSAGQTKPVPQTGGPVKKVGSEAPAETAPVVDGAGETESPAPGNKNNDPILRPPLIGTGRTIPEVAVPDVAIRVKAILTKELGGLRKGDPAIPVIFQKVWKSKWPESFNAPLQSARNSRIASGEILPDELANFQVTSHQFISDLQKGQGDLLIDDAEMEAAYLLLTLSIGDAQSGAGNLIKALADRADQLPPSKGDLILFNVVIQSLRDLRQGGATAASFDDLQSLADGKNPIYRLIALQASSGAVSEKTRYASSENSQTELDVAALKAAFYKPYLKESDPHILREALRAMGAVPSQDAMKSLLDFRSDRAGQADLVAIADEAIHGCEAVMKSYNLAK